MGNVQRYSRCLIMITGVRKSRIHQLAQENATYQERCKFRSLSKEEKQKTKKELVQEFVEICQIYAKVREGKRRIQRAVDGKWYAVKI